MRIADAPDADACRIRLVSRKPSRMRLVYIPKRRVPPSVWSRANDVVAQDVERLLEHLDNDVARVETLLAEMLARRDHWLRHIHGKDRDELEAALKSARHEALRRLCSLAAIILPRCKANWSS